MDWKVTIPSICSLCSLVLFVLFGVDFAWSSGSDNGMVHMSIGGRNRNLVVAWLRRYLPIRVKMNQGRACMALEAFRASATVHFKLANVVAARKDN